MSSSLKIRINKQAIPPESKPATKRRIQRIESDNEEQAPSYEPNVPEPRPKKARTLSLGASADSVDDLAAVEDEDIDIDGDIEDTRFLPEPQAAASRSISPIASSSKRKSAAASSSKSRPKEKEKSSKGSKSGKKRRQVVFTDSEEDFDDPDVVVTDDDDFEPAPDYATSKKTVKPRGVKLLVGGAKGKAAKKEDKEITFRDERKLLPPAPPAAQPSKRVDEGTRHSDSLDEPVPKKRKLPPIKKNKPAGGTSTGSSTPAASKPNVAAAADKKETLTPALTSNQVGTRKLAGASSDINLLDSSVYSELFRSAQPGGGTPNSGLNRKQKEEERRKELNKMRDEARAKREAEARHCFDLQAAPEKIQRYEDGLRVRHSMAVFPNIIGGAFKEMYERQRAVQRALAERR
ncbi:hypothetical protein L226DRAFT_530467 [Lentinus tigrinus ALCF2SS1-7]|uniref:uncharacterized protein n=1 Tax=Lentinus tigrinus ALCF2SS1-7 TaxID=1328758 RepID=UPI0011662478|nr:hypothetical protein L226DRAFT_530467 [Lentinus tigrinus ALCF2SS1-7]